MQTEEQKFLNEYNKRQFDAPIVTVDPVLFTYHEAQLKVLLVQRAEHPGKNKWGLTQVTYSSHETRAEAYKSLKNIKYNVSEDAWLLVKKLQ